MAQNYIKPITTGIPNTISKTRNDNKSYDKPFSDFLNNSIDEIKYSKHAASRINSRSINMTEDDQVKVKEAIKKASQKGIKDSLIIFNDKAFVVNVDSKTVVTAMDKESITNKVFTNIDGAVLV